jgi:hypothetical protein
MLRLTGSGGDEEENGKEEGSPADWLTDHVRSLNLDLDTANSPATVLSILSA